MQPNNVWYILNVYFFYSFVGSPFPLYGRPRVTVPLVDSGQPSLIFLIFYPVLPIILEAGRSCLHYRYGLVQMYIKYKLYFVDALTYCDFVV